MVFVSVDDFLSETKKVKRLTRSEEKELGQRKNDGDTAARQALIYAYYPHVGAVIRRSPSEIKTLNTLYRCLDTLEKAVDCFNFLQDGETFSHALSFRLRQCITRCIADRY